MSDPADDYDAAAEKFMAAFDAFVREQFGERCETFDPECPCCKLWKLRDQVDALVTFN